MDPNATLSAMLENARMLETDRDQRGDDAPQSAADDAELAYVLAQQVVDLHEWLEKGGFLPTAWEAGRKAHADEIIVPLSTYLGYRPPQ